MEAAAAADVPPVRLSQPQNDTSVRAFLRVTTVRQALLLFLGSLFYDIGSIACVPCGEAPPSQQARSD